MQDDERVTMQFGQSPDQSGATRRTDELIGSPTPSFHTEPFQAPMAAGAPTQKTMVLNQPVAALAWLIVMSGLRTGHTAPIDAAGSWIGRDAQNDLVLDDQAVSRRHAKVWRETTPQNEERYYIQDLASGNGTFVNDQNIVRAVLKDGDRVRIGETQLVFKTVEPAEKPKPRPEPIVLEDRSGGGSANTVGNAATNMSANAAVPEAGNCTNCGTALVPGAQFCFECGTPVARPKSCSNCGHPVQPFMKFCPNCGTKQE